MHASSMTVLLKNNRQLLKKRKHLKEIYSENPIKKSRRIYRYKKASPALLQKIRRQKEISYNKIFKLKILALSVLASVLVYSIYFMMNTPSIF